MTPLTHIVMANIFDVQRMDFMEPFPSSFWNECIFKCVDYTPKRVKEISTRTSETKLVTRFL